MAGDRGVQQRGVEHGAGARARPGRARTPGRPGRSGDTPPYVGFTPTVPVTAAGWRIDPPVSVPTASGASNAATAAAEPPPDPPGMRSRSHGLWVGPNAECSVELTHGELVHVGLAEHHEAGVAQPADHGRVVRRHASPRASATRRSSGCPSVAMTSLSASGTPASGPSCSPAPRRASSRRAVSRAPSASTCRNACTSPSTAAIRARCASVTSSGARLAGGDGARRSRQRSAGSGRRSARGS